MDHSKELEKALRALSQSIYESMDDGVFKDNAAILLIVRNGIYLELDRITQRANDESTFYTREQAKDVLDYLRCVRVGLKQFANSMGLEETT